MSAFAIAKSKSSSFKSWEELHYKRAEKRRTSRIWVHMYRCVDYKWWMMLLECNPTQKIRKFCCASYLLFWQKLISRSKFKFLIWIFLSSLDCLLANSNMKLLCKTKSSLNPTKFKKKKKIIKIIAKLLSIIFWRIFALCSISQFFTEKFMHTFSIFSAIFPNLEMWFFKMSYMRNIV